MPHVSGKTRAIGPSLRVAILGCGRVAETCHLPALQTLKDRIHVVAVADIDEHRRRRVGGMFEIGQIFQSLEPMLAEARIDAIAICLPVAFHADAVVAALQAGKHVLVEKPLALSMRDADRIVGAATAHYDLKITVGFNLRHHRLVRKARQMIASGMVGEIQFLRTVWSSNIRTAMQVPPWRNRREMGGGVFCEIAVHHIDLIRFLTGAQVNEISAQSTHGEGDDEAGTISLRMDNGALASCAFCEKSTNANEIEVVGTKGRLTFSPYRFDSLRFVPTDSYTRRLHDVMQTFKGLPEAWPILRRGGDFKESYRQEWIALADAIGDQQSPLATVEDGREALRVVLAAGAAANARKAISIHDAPQEPQPVPNRPEQSTRSTEDSHRPKLSAIIATRDSFESIRRTISHLRAQTVVNQIELVIVCPMHCQLGLDENELKGFWAHRVVEIERFDSLAPANAAGVRAASAPVVVLCEDHAFPDPTWAQSLVIAHRGPYAVVGPAVHNANPDTAVSRADFLIGYGPWAEPIKPCEAAHLPGHNSAYKRNILLSYGDHLEEMMEAESVLQWDMLRNGHRLYLDPTARLAHTNFAKLGIWTKVQFHNGRVFAAVRSKNWPIHKRLFYMCASPLIPLARLKRIGDHWRRIRGSVGFNPSVLLLLVWGLTLDGIGQMIGYVSGAGESNRLAHEFCRMDHITEKDRQQLAATEQSSLSPNA